MAVIGWVVRDEFKEFLRHAIRMSPTGCEITDTVLTQNRGVVAVYVSAAEMKELVTAKVARIPATLPRTDGATADEAMHKVAAEMGLEISRPTTRPWNLYVTRRKP